MAAPQAPPPLLAPPLPPTEVRVVDPFTRGSYPSVAAALNGARPGARIEIHPGLYEDPLDVDVAVHLVGLGALGQVVLRNGAGPTIVARADLELTNLTLRSGGPVIVADEGTSTSLSKCELATSTGPALTIASEFRLRFCRVQSGNGSAVTFVAGTAGHIERCTITAPDDALVVQHGARPNVTECLVSSSGGRALAVLPGGGGHFAKNDLHSTSTTDRATVAVGLGASPSLVDNVITALNGHALAVGGGGTYSKNKLTSDAPPSIPTVLVCASADPVLRANHIGATNSNALAIAGAGFFEDNVITSGPGDRAAVTVGPWPTPTEGEVVPSGVSPTLRRNTISSTNCTALALDGVGKGRYENNTINSSAPIHYAAVSVGPGAEPHFVGNRVTSVRGNALWVRSGGRGTFELNTFASAARDTVEMSPGAVARLVGNEIRARKGWAHIHRPLFQPKRLPLNQLIWDP